MIDKDKWLIIRTCSENLRFGMEAIGSGLGAIGWGIGIGLALFALAWYETGGMQ